MQPVCKVHVAAASAATTAHAALLKLSEFSTGGGRLHCNMGARLPIQGRLREKLVSLAMFCLKTLTAALRMTANWRRTSASVQRHPG
jgi:hypothetical protein